VNRAGPPGAARKRHERPDKALAKPKTEDSGRSKVAIASGIASFPQRRRQMLATRFGAGLLSLFVCARCRRLAVDPCGRFGRREFLCDDCADGRMGC
jgi:hypothetical protein